MWCKSRRADAGSAATALIVTGLVHVSGFYLFVVDIRHRQPQYLQPRDKEESRYAPRAGAGHPAPSFICTGAGQ
ncbi:MAG TPA: hypothetical protein VK629_14880 [Steroidobacteraceae bacterium]|nr:hypothetical protein [Steroidobacteraceae bacterium]